MKRLILAITAAFFTLFAGSADAQQAFQWQTATPESQGMSREKLDAIRAVLEAKKTKAFLVARNDKIIYEWYAPDHGPTKPHGTASLAKAIVGGLSLAVAMTDGKIGLDDPAAKYVPEWKNDPRKSKILIRHLGSHTSGIEDAEADDSDGKKIPHERLTGWKGDFWKRLDPPHDAFSISRDQTPTLFDPGQKLQYSNPGIGMLTYCTTAAIQSGDTKDIRTLLSERAMRPIGVPDNEWSCGYGKTYTVNGLPLVCSWGGGNYTARAAASIGRLMLREGDWDGRRVLSQESVRLTTGSAGQPGACGMGWWTNAERRYQSIPSDAYWGAGAGDQLLLVVPSLNLIIVRNGQTLEPGAGEASVRQDDVFTKYHDYRARVLLEPVVGAVVAAAAAPQASRAVYEAAPERVAKGKLTVASNDQAITVASSFGPGWKATVDRQRGGVITALHLPISGDNLVSNDGSRFEGLFNTIYVDFKETGKDGAYLAKGALYSFGNLSKMMIVEQREDQVVVEVEGTAGNQVQPKADVLRYRQRYTFLADRIHCDGELQWLYGKVVEGSHPELLQMQCLFAPGAVTGELRGWDADTGPLELPQTNSKGKNLPAGFDYPFTVEVPIKDGHALHVRSLKMPLDVLQARFYWNEYPRQIDNKRGFAFKAWEGWPGNGSVSFASDKPIYYTYEVVVAPPLPPPSPVISKLTWAPKESIIRKAKGGDNWPITWADDDQLYTAYGDANGFEPFLKEKLSMGLVRIAGGSADFRGINLRSPSFEQKGDGAKGKKASGMLMVDGVLYMLVRNAANSQLAWSADHGQTWTWSDWRFTKSFGCPTFLNFGKNYSEARDEYVYIYSLDHDSAYEAADRMVLARVPKTRIKEQAAYEFFAGLDAKTGPTWIKDIDKRAAVFSHSGKCYRSGVTYNAALKRYLWCQVLPTSKHPQGPRFQGGFGVYDAPEPWGPWTTVFYTDEWDVGPGETNSFPTKWMSADGKTLHLVFSGDDYFSVRKATLEVAP